MLLLDRYADPDSGAHRERCGHRKDDVIVPV
jgi:hypothetical protein